MKMRLAAGMLALLLAGCSNPESSMQLGNIAYRRGDKAAAVEYYKAAAQDSKTRAAANYNLGRVAFEEQQYEQALQYLDLALELKVEHPLVLVYRARTLLALGREERPSQKARRKKQRVNPPMGTGVGGCRRFQKVVLLLVSSAPLDNN